MKFSFVPLLITGTNHFYRSTTGAPGKPLAGCGAMLISKSMG